MYTTMERKMKILRIAVLCLVCTFTGVVLAHDIGSKSSLTRAQWNPDRLSFMPVDRVPKLSGSANDRMTEYVVVLPNKWAQTQTIHVCFVGGSVVLREKILKMA